ncbi:(Fe-S)-binding protein, partial [Burkholderia semiarida]|uniref:(Fe-S)-binding protein n=1 Tax=Burkholderia semiarida TaxID=2843303 RepID=UPI0023DD6A10
AVFYFPGCGSERLFSQVGLATQAMLWEAGVQTVLPPGYLCCGYPQRGSGQYDKAEKIVTDNRVLFHRVANTLNYLDIKTVVVSCGTCYDQLAGYEFDKIFPGCRIIDIHEFLLEKGMKLDGVTGTRYMYHDPCHTPIKTMDPVKLVNELMGSEKDGYKIEKNDRCCGESGTLAVTRPDISTQVRFRKEEEIRKGAAKLRAIPVVAGDAAAPAADGGGLQGAALRERHAQEGRDEADAAPAGDDRQAAGGRAGDPLREQEDAGQPAEEDGARAAGHRGQQDRADHPQPEIDDCRFGSGVLLPGLRLRAAVLAGGAGDAGDAVGGGRA